MMYTIFHLFKIHNKWAETGTISVSHILQVRITCESRTELRGRQLDATTLTVRELLCVRYHVRHSGSTGFEPSTHVNHSSEASILPWNYSLILVRISTNYLDVHSPNRKRWIDCHPNKGLQRQSNLSKFTWNWGFKSRQKISRQGGRVLGLLLLWVVVWPWVHQSFHIFISSPVTGRCTRRCTGADLLTSAEVLVLCNCFLFSPLFEILGGKEMNHTEPESGSDS